MSEPKIEANQNNDDQGSPQEVGDPADQPPEEEHLEQDQLSGITGGAMPKRWP